MIIIKKIQYLSKLNIPILRMKMFRILFKNKWLKTNKYKVNKNNILHLVCKIIIKTKYKHKI